MKHIIISRFSCLILLLNCMIMLAQHGPNSRASAVYNAHSLSSAEMTGTEQSEHTAGGYILKSDNNGLLDFDVTLGQELQRTLEAIYATYPMGGLSAAVLIPGQGMWTGVCGYSTLEPMDSIRPDMIFNLCGADQTILSALLLLLAEDGKLSLDDSIGSYLPNLPATISGQITIRQLLNMTSGLYDYINENAAFEDSLFSDLNRIWTYEEIINLLVGPSHTPPGAANGLYSNTDFVLVCEIIRNVTQTSASEQFHQRIFEPLSLERTYFPPDDTLVGPAAHTWSNNIDNWGITSSNAWLSLHSGPGGMFATSEDLTRFANALFSGQLVTSASLEQIQSLYFPWGPALGVGLCIYGEKILGKMIWDGGSSWSNGCLSVFYYYPPTGFSYAVLGNNDNSWMSFYYSTQLLFNEYLKTIPVASASQSGVLYMLSSNNDGLMCKANTPSIDLSTLGTVLYPGLSKVKVHPVTGDLWGLAKPGIIGWQLVKFDGITGEAFPRVEISISTASSLKGMDFASNGTLFLASYDGKIYTTDTATGVTTLLVSTEIPIAAMTIQPGTGTIWASAKIGQSSDPRIFTINLENGDTIGIGNTGLDQQLSDIAFDAQGNLFGIIGYSPSRLVHIDATTGKGTEVESFDTTNIVSIAFSAEAALSNQQEYYTKQPDRTELSLSYPNPFDSETNIELQIPESNHVTLKIYSANGCEVATLINENLSPGSHKVMWDARSFPGGIYFYRLEIGSYIESSKLVLLR